jgi:hypothetical protein
MRIRFNFFYRGKNFGVFANVPGYYVASENRILPIDSSFVEQSLRANEWKYFGPDNELWLLNRFMSVAIIKDIFSKI